MALPRETRKALGVCLTVERTKFKLVIPTVFANFARKKRSFHTSIRDQNPNSLGDPQDALIAIGGAGRAWREPTGPVPSMELKG